MTGLFKRKTEYIKIIVCIVFMMLVTSCNKQGVTSDNEKFSINIEMEGGTGKAYIESPVSVTKKEDGYELELVWSSKNYDYMIVDGVRYENEASEGENSKFTVTVKSMEEPLAVIGDTIAMSTPHEIEYIIYFDGKGKESPAEDSIGGSSKKTAETGDTDYNSLKFDEETILEYAKEFTIKKCEGYSLINIKDGDDVLVIEEGFDVPKNVPEKTVIIKKPVENAYIVSTSVMDPIREFDALSDVRLSGTKESDWYIEEVKDLMKEKKILYAGKYGAPDYELILSENCDLAIENTMIYHKPEAKEKLEELGIPVLVERSSYEPHPLGRLEWIKAFGLIFDREKEAKEFYDSQLETVSALTENSDKNVSVVFFHVTATGMINVKKPGDYVAKTIELAGGDYAIKDIKGDDADSMSGMNMQMEDFYVAAKDADILIYNSTIGGEIKNTDELIKKNALFKDFKAVKEKKVYCTGRNFFQESTHIAEFMTDLSEAFSGNDENLTYIKRLN